MDNFRVSRNSANISLMVILLLGFSLRLHNLSMQSLWLDEIFSTKFIFAPAADVLVNLILDKVHPPLYYFALSIWSELGYSAFLLRLFSVFWGVLTIPVMFCLGRLVGGSLVGLSAALLLAISPFHIWYSQEVRMHTLVVFAVTLGGCFLLRLVRHDTRSNWLGYTLSMLTAVYTHYFAVLILVSHGLVLMGYRKRYPALWHTFLRRGILIGILFSAWILLVVLLGNVADGRVHLSWIQAIRWYEPILTLVAFSIGSAITFSQPITFVVPFIFVVALFYLLIMRFKQNGHVFSHEAHFHFNLLWVWLLFPLFVTWLVSLDFFPSLDLSLYMDRNLIVILPGLLVLVSWGLVILTEKRSFSQIVILGLVVLISLLPLQRMYTNPIYFRQDWQTAFATVADVIEEDEALLLPFLAQLGWWYYGENHTYIALDIEFDETVFSHQIEDVKKEHGSVWLISSATNVNPHGFPQERNAYIVNAEQNDPFAAWLNKHYGLETEYYYSGIRLAKYELQ